MKSKFNAMVVYFSNSPRNLFVLDGIGAALTTCLLFFGLRQFPAIFGISVEVLNCLAAIGLVYVFYNTACYVFVRKKWSMYIRILGVGNLLYCFLTLLWIWKQYEVVTSIGIAYVTSEIIIILSLVYLEFQIAKKIK